MWPISSFPPPTRGNPLSPVLLLLPLLFLSFFVPACVSPPWRTHVSNFLPGFPLLPRACYDRPHLSFPTPERRTILRVVVTAEFVGTITPRLAITMLGQYLSRPFTRILSVVRPSSYFCYTASRETCIFVTRSCVIVFSLARLNPFAQMRVAYVALERKKPRATIMFYLRDLIA